MNKLNAKPGVRGDEQLSALARVLKPAAGEACKDHDVLEFLGLPEPHSENDHKRAMVRPMKAFVLELCKDLLFVSEELRKPHENPSMGVLLCSDKDDEVVEYALSRNLSPALVAQCQLQLLDNKLLLSKLHELLAQNWGG
jgi:YhcG PDDEXK nuclease domain